ncbi:hypothetical protein BH18ACT5_BH18ACT5_05020 [soil metagenome]
MPATLTEWIESYRLAWENRDPEAAAKLFTPEATYRSNIFEEPHQGQEGVHAYWTQVTSDQGDPKVRMGRPFVDGQRVALEFWTTMKVDGEETTLPGCMLLAFDNDWRCCALREYYHFASGRTEPPMGWGD